MLVLEVSSQESTPTSAEPNASFGGESLELLRFTGATPGDPGVARSRDEA